MIQLSRFLTLLRAREPEAVITGRVPVPLAGLLARAFPTIAFTTEAEREPDYDLFVPSMQLPAVLGATDLEPRSRYIELGAPHVDLPSRPAKPRTRVGICWRGHPRQFDLTRSIPLDLFAGLFRVPDIDFIVLLNSLTAEEESALSGMDRVEIPRIHDFLDLAAAIGTCDLVVSVDTAGPASRCSRWCARAAAVAPRCLLALGRHGGLPLVRDCRSPASRRRYGLAAGPGRSCDAPRPAQRRSDAGERRFVTASEDLTSTDGPWRVADQLRILAFGPSDDDAARAAAVVAEAAEATGVRVVAHGAASAGGLRDRWLTPADCGADLLVIDVASQVGASALAELRRVAGTDPMLLGTIPRFAGAACEAAAWAALPGVTYTTLPDLRCCYVKGSVLAAFAGSLRDGAANAPGDDLATSLLLLNRFGFRVGIANHALVIRSAEAPVSRVARALIPAEFGAALSYYSSSSPLQAERIMQGLDPGPDGRLALAFDLAHVTASHSGTSELSRALILRAGAQWHDVEIHVIATATAFAFHFGESQPTLHRVDPADPRCFAVLIRIGQPFLWGEMERAVLRAPVLIFFMLDTIGLDCLVHAPDELDALWRFALSEADGLLFNSVFTQRQFARRFTIRPGLPCRASLHSLDLAEYRDPADHDATDAAPPSDRGATEAVEPVGVILVIGNGFSHKHIRETATLLAAAGLSDRVVVLGLPPGTVAGMTSVPSGALDARRLSTLFRSARLVVYPSVYEGFGFPVLEALAHRKPILVRPLAPYDEIAAGLPESCNIYRFKDDAELLGLLAQKIRWIEKDAAVRPRNWDDATSDLREVVAEALGGVTYDRVLRRLDMLRGRMAYMRARARAPADELTEGSDNLDRLAGAAGRLAQTIVLTMGRRIPGTRAIMGFADRALRPRRRS